MRKYEVMFILKPDLTQDKMKALFNQINEAVVKNNGNVLSADVWSEKRKLYFPIKKYREGLYYLMNFEVLPHEIIKIGQAYKLNENILRVLLTNVE